MSSVLPEPLSSRLPAEARKPHPFWGAQAWERAPRETPLPPGHQNRTWPALLTAAKGRPGAVGASVPRLVGLPVTLCLRGAQAGAGGPNPSCRCEKSACTSLTGHPSLALGIGMSPRMALGPTHFLSPCHSPSGGCRAPESFQTHSVLLGGGVGEELTDRDPEGVGPGGGACQAEERA